MKKFDLARALLGEPIKHFKTGQKSYIIGETKSAKYRKDCYVVQVENLNEADEDILTVEYITALEMNYVMWEEPRPTVTLTLPCPLEEWVEGCYLIDDGFQIKRSTQGWYRKQLQEGRYFATEADAQTWVAAMRNNRK